MDVWGIYTGWELLPVCTVPTADRLKFLLVGSGFTLPRSNDRCTVYVTVVVGALMVEDSVAFDCLRATKKIGPAT